MHQTRRLKQHPPSLFRKYLPLSQDARRLPCTSLFKTDRVTRNRLAEIPHSIVITSKDEPWLPHKSYSVPEDLPKFAGHTTHHSAVKLCLILYKLFTPIHRDDMIKVCWRNRQIKIYSQLLLGHCGNYFWATSRVRVLIDNPRSKK